MGKRSLDSFVPKFFLPCSVLDLCMNFIGHGHDECSEMHRLENDNMTIVILALVVVIVVGQ